MYINIHEYAHGIFFKSRPMKSINLSIDFIGLITKRHNYDSLGLKLVYLWIFNDFSVFFFKFSLNFMNMQEK